MSPKVLGVAENEIRRLTEHMPWTDARHAADAVALSRECDHTAWQEEPLRTALLMAGMLDGFPRYAKMHPCGMVLSRHPILPVLRELQEEIFQSLRSNSGSWRCGVGF